MGDFYFQRLHELRNDSAQQLRRSGSIQSAVKPMASMSMSSIDGCESVQNDMREVADGKKGCEAI